MVAEGEIPKISSTIRDAGKPVPANPDPFFLDRFTPTSLLGYRLSAKRDLAVFFREISR